MQIEGFEIFLQVSEFQVLYIEGCCCLQEALVSVAPPVAMDKELFVSDKSWLVRYNVKVWCKREKMLPQIHFWVELREAIAVHSRR